MDVDSFFIFLFSTIGLTIIVTQSKLFRPFRNLCKKINKHLGYLSGCPMCIGFWSGIFIYILQLYKVDFILYGLIGSIFSYVAYLLLCPLIERYD